MPPARHIRFSFVRRALQVVPSAFLGLVCASVVSVAPSRAEPDPNQRAGIWTISAGSSKNECRVVLRTDAAEKGYGLAMPPGCRKALPALKPVQSWSMTDDDAVQLDDASGQPIVTFDKDNSGVLRAAASDGQPLTLTKLDPTKHTDDDPTVVNLNPVAAGYAKAKAAKDAGNGPGTTTASATPNAGAPARAAPVTVSGTAGNYAVLRGDRDTGCMVTLDEKGRGPKGSLRAHLAPACRDQGIVIFDPLGWQLQGQGLVLTARKGHTVTLQMNADGLWVKQPEDMKGLTLKRL
jgi:hypothetical protein